MLLGLMLASGNDAAVAIAEHIAGTVDAFAAMMNARAKVIGAVNTHFVNPHGLPDDDHYTTAYDLALIAREAMGNESFRRLVSTSRATIPWEGRTYDRQLRNKNRLLTDYPGATGIKTGFTSKAGRCLVFGAARDGMELVGVVLGCSNWFDEAELTERRNQVFSVSFGSHEAPMTAATEFCSGYYGAHRTVSTGSMYRYSYVSCQTEIDEEATNLARARGELDENGYAFWVTVIFVPDNNRALRQSMAGNTGEYTGSDPNIPSKAMQYTRCGYIRLTADGWIGEIVGSMW
jgi:D-alanyl-D-alanine carboxypeptidase